MKKDNVLCESSLSGAFGLDPLYWVFRVHHVLYILFLGKMEKVSCQCIRIKNFCLRVWSHLQTVLFILHWEMGPLKDTEGSLLGIESAVCVNGGFS